MKPAYFLSLILPLLVWQVQADVAIEAPGGDDALLENLRARLGLAGMACDAPASQVRRLFNRAEKDFRPALRAFGYYRAVVEKKLETGGDCWQASFVVEVGERVTIRKRTVTVKGPAADDRELKTLLSELPLTQGSQLNHGQYESIKSRLRDYATQRGYFDYKLTQHELRVYPQEAAAEIDIEADSGPRYRFGELRLNEVPLDDDFVRRLARIRAGEPYDTRQLTALDRNLTGPGYFRRVEVRPLRDESKDETVPVDVLLEPRTEARLEFRCGLRDRHRSAREYRL